MSAIPIETWISNYGFPIAMCLIVYLDLRKQIIELTNAVKTCLPVK